ncbi:MAG: non-ribosomal peptide synthetase, partial [bacterium]|nr:non-ribosomal peptide synthetase [bacterium]
LCAYIVLPANFEKSPHFDGELRQFLTATLPEYMVPSHFVDLEIIPLTPNGKVDRKALPEPNITRSDSYTAPTTESEKKLVHIWSAILRIEEDAIGIDDDFFQLGGHSLKATVMISNIHKSLEVKLNLTDIFKHTTVRRLAQVVEVKTKESFLAIEPAPEKPYYPVSSAQKRLYIMQQIDPRNLDYNMNWLYILEGDLDPGRLENAYKKVIERHEVLRTGIEMTGISPVQIVYPQVQFRMEQVDGTDEFGGAVPSEDRMLKMARQFVRPFELAKPPLIRVRIVKINPLTHILLMDVHHIVTDGASNLIIIREVVTGYDGVQLPAPKLQYKDFSHWQNKLIADGVMKAQEEYWLKRFEGELPKLELPIDFPRPAVHNAEGSGVHFYIDTQLKNRIQELLTETGTTFYIFLLAIYIILLFIHTGQKDIIVGSAVGGRRHADLENILGIFVNMLAFRIRPDENTAFSDYLEEVKETCLGAYENQDFQFDELVAKLEIEAQLGSTPLFDTQFNLNTVAQKEKDGTVLEGPDIRLKQFEYGHETLPFHLGLIANESPDSIEMILAFLPALFKKESIEKMTKHFMEILEQCLDNRDIKIKEIAVSHDLAAGESKLDEDELDGFDF